MELNKLHCGIISSMLTGSVYYPLHATREYELAFGELMCAGYVSVVRVGSNKYYATEEGCEAYERYTKDM